MPANVTVVRPQVAAPVWSGPALALTEGGTLKVIFILSELELQGALAVVQVSV